MRGCPIQRRIASVHSCHLPFCERTPSLSARQRRKVRGVVGAVFPYVSAYESSSRRIMVWYGVPYWLAASLKKAMLRRLKPMVTFRLSSLNASWSGDGKKSVMILTGPIGSAVYFVFLLIYCLSFSPVSCANDPDHVISICESNRQYPFINPAEAVETLL